MTELSSLFHSLSIGYTVRVSARAGTLPSGLTGEAPPLSLLVVPV